MLSNREFSVIVTILPGFFVFVGNTNFLDDKVNEKT